MKDIINQYGSAVIGAVSALLILVILLAAVFGGGSGKSILDYILMLSQRFCGA